MTRGSGYLITDNYIYFHDEFNGDMYRDGHGESFILALDKTTAASYPHIITEWNKANHNYSSFKTYKQLLQQPDYQDHIKVEKDMITINFTVDYFKWWFSDWIFIKNSSSKDIHIITRTNLDGVAGKTVIIKEGETYAFSFGYAMDDDDVYTAEDVRTNPIVKVEDGNN